MTATTSTTATGNSSIDAMFAGTQWATNSLTYSFPANAALYGTYSTGEPANNFKAFTAAQQTQIHNVLQNYSDVANLHFTEVAESSSSTGTIRYAESDKPSTAWGYYPSSGAAGGDVWFNNSSHYYDNPAKGNYGYSLFLHETGHALGLKHPHEASGSFGTMPADHDSVEYTVMSYHSYVGSSAGSYSVGSGSYPQSLMMYDIAALQAMYGANYTTENGDTTYRWDPTTGRESINGVAEIAPTTNKIFLTVWDGGGNDTYDFSNYTTNLKVDLSPGGWTTVSSTQLANLGGGHSAAGNIANALLYQNNPASLIENAIGGAGADSIVGNQADNHLTGMAGNDKLDGGAGTDTAVYSGTEANYTWTQNADGSWLVTDSRTGGDGVDTLLNIEQLQFADGTVWIGPAAPVVNTAPVITTAAQSTTLTEWADLSTAEASNTAHTAKGTIGFSDPNTLDVHTATVSAGGSGYLGSFTLGAVDESTDTLGWSFSVSDSALDYLNAGQTLNQTYAVTINDGHGGTATQKVSITLAGAADGTTTTTTTTTTTGSNGGGKAGKITGKKGGGNAAGNDTAEHDNSPAPSTDKFSFDSGHGHADATPHLGGLFGASTHAVVDNHATQMAAGLFAAEDIVHLDLHTDATATIDHTSDWLV